MFRVVAFLMLLLVLVAVRFFLGAALATTRTPWATFGKAFAWVVVFSVWGLIPPQCTRNPTDEPPDYRPLSAKLPGAYWVFAVGGAGILWAAWSERKRFPDPD